MNARPVLALALLAGCPAGASLTQVAQADLTIPVDADVVEGELRLELSGLTDETLQAYAEPIEDWYGRGGLRFDVVLEQVDDGRVDVTLADDAVGIHRWRRDGLPGAQRSEWDNTATDRDEARWHPRFLLVRYLEVDECLGADPCEIAVPLALSRRRGQASALEAQVRFGMYDNSSPALDELDGVSLTATWVPAE